MKKIKNFLKKYSEWVPSKYLIVTILFLLIFFYNIKDFTLDNDFWFIINTGKCILRNGFITIEPFTIHEGFSFVAQQWLTGIIFYTIYHKFGIIGMFIFMNIFYIAIIYLMYKLCTLICNTSVKLPLFITSISCIFLAIMFITTRPQIFDILLILLELYLLELYIKSNSKKYLIGLPIISLLFINFHAATWWMLFVLMIPYIIEFIVIKKERFRIKPLLLSIVIMFIFGFINPYGINAIDYLFKSYNISYINDFVNEMRPITINNGMYYFLYIFIILLSYYFNNGRNKPFNIRYFLLFIGTTYLGFSHLKGIVYLIITSVLALNYNYSNLFTEQHQKESKKGLLPKISCATLCIFLSLLCLYNMNFVKEEDLPQYKVANYLDKNTSKNSRLYTSYDNGGYFEYRGYKCYLDPRAEVFVKKQNKKEDIMKEFYDLQITNISIYNFLKKYNFDYLIIDNNDELFNKLEDISLYKEVYKVNGNKSNSNYEYKVYKRVI